MFLLISLVGGKNLVILIGVGWMALVLGVFVGGPSPVISLEYPSPIGIDDGCMCMRDLDSRYNIGSALVE